jgi:two-component system cell cycle sensor histidine kinase/response regulator CckA
MPDGGTIDVSARNVDDPRGSGSAPRGVGKFIRVSINDTGVGIPEKYLSRIFDPYFTTKQQGSGLGLATSHSIVRNHGGTLRVESTQGAGTTFTIVLPAIESPKAAGAEPPAEMARTHRRCRVLVMDDEVAIRDVVRRMVSALGHDVEVAAHGEEALDKYRQSMAAGKPFDLVVLDLTIKGGLGGEGTIRQLLALDPNVKAVVSSGYSDDPIVSDYRSYGFSALLTKPYQLGQLRDCLDALVR